jgi:hypothetical protein
MNLTEKTLGKCGCCEGVEVLTPKGIRNDAGLSALLFRIGTHGTFKASMLRGLSDSGCCGCSPPVKTMTTRLP